MIHDIFMIFYEDIFSFISFLNAFVGLCSCVGGVFCVGVTGLDELFELSEFSSKLLKLFIFSHMFSDRELEPKFSKTSGSSGSTLMTSSSELPLLSM